MPSLDGTTNGPSDFPAGAPQTPVLQTNLFNQLIELAAAAGSTLAPIFPLNLNNMTNTFNLTKVNVTGRINGPGVLVATGDIDLDVGTSLDGNIQLISGGTVTIIASGSLGSNDLVYARNDICLDSPTANDPIELTAGNCALIALGTVRAEKDFTFSGLIFGGEVWFKKSATILGMILSAGGITIDMNLTESYDAGQFSEYIPLAFKPGIKVLDWRELPR